MSTMTSIPYARGRLPVVGHLAAFARAPLGFLSSIPEQGNLVRIKLGSLDAVVVCDANLTRKLLLDDRVFDKGGQIFDRAYDALRDGLATCPHAVHRRLRPLIQPTFNPARIPAYSATMSEKIAAVTESWRDGEVLDVTAEMLKLASSTAAAVFFGGSELDATDRDQVMADMATLFNGVFRVAMMPPSLYRLPIPGNNAHRDAVMRSRRVLAEIIARHRTSASGPDSLLSALLTARSDDGRRLSDAEISDQVISFFMAGTDTTATTLAWALYFVDRNPAVAQRLREEVDNVLGGRVARFEDLSDLQVTKQIITETLRMRSPVWMLTRKVSEDTELGGYRLPAGTVVLYSNYVLHHRRDLLPDPDRFDPDRWDPYNPDRPPRDAIIPFGFGPRKCIGDKFAMTETTLALATIVNRWQLSTLSDREVKPVVSSVIMHPRRLRMRARTRAAS
ncbi:cytochrome P450 [Nocardia sp. CDC159]|uniref:Cytochrome P450 n=1 Tax=Nocardia pulmonis TaxID=2951408 RepID=A0A9X2EDR0_9NOCA|nr:MULTISPECIES: cytochrome P450 [Nocardia]MCM6778445.1 cytochrome P450 [Nocardia pulmonis]MCM6791334.1 cytochrome P450 [Nocardia sp. CDC159]